MALKTAQLVEKQKQKLLEKHLLEMVPTADKVEVMSAKLIEMSMLVVDTVYSDLKDGKLTSYNAGCTFANVLGSLVKLQRVRLEQLQALQGIVPIPAKNEPDEPEDNTRRDEKLARLSEALLTRAVQMKVSGEDI